MSTFLYPNFLEDRQEYAALRAFWIAHLKEIMPPGQAFESYANDKFADGELFFDGNPIASVVNWKTRRGVRIVQESPTELGEHYTSWTSNLRVQPKNRPTPVAVEEKVIALTLTEATLERSLKDVEEWLKKNETAT